MSTKRTSDKAGWVIIAKLPRGPNGRALCRRCGTEVPKGRRSWCSVQCVSDHRVESDPSYARFQVGKRDNGICALCRLDCNRLEAMLERKHGGAHRDRVRRLFYLVTGRPHTSKFATWRSLWEMDHVKPVVEGGGACGLDNLRTLCVWCHNRATAELRRRLAWQRKRDNATRLGFPNMPEVDAIAPHVRQSDQHDQNRKNRGLGDRGRRQKV